MTSIENDQTETLTQSDMYSINVSSKNLITKAFSHNDKKLLVKRISDIKSKKCYLKIFELVHSNNLKYTKNDNGIFFNIIGFPDDILTKIEDIIRHYENKKNQQIQQNS